MNGADSERELARPAEIDFGEVSRRLAYHLPRMLSDLLGIDARGGWPRGATKTIEVGLRRAWPALQGLHKDAEVLSPREAMLRMGDLFSALVPLGLRIPKGKHPIDWLLHKQGKIFRDLDAHPVGRKYLRAVNRVIDKHIQGDRLEAANDYLASSGQQEAAVVFQSFFRRSRERGFASCMRGLETKQPSMQHVPQLLRLYLTLAGTYEKSICRLLGLIDIQEGREPDYDRLRGQRLQTKMARLEKHPDMAVFAKGFNRHLRNAIAHESVQFLPTQRRIEFRVGKEKVSLSPGQLCKQVVETTALVTALLLLDSLRVYSSLLALSRLRKEAEE